MGCMANSICGYCLTTCYRSVTTILHVSYRSVTMSTLLQMSVTMAVHRKGATRTITTGAVAHTQILDAAENIDLVRQMVQAALDRFGGLNVLYNNAGIFESEALEDISVEQWDAMFATNTRAPFLMAKAAHPHLRATRGRILNIGSLGGLHPWATHAHYCTSKAALHMLSKTMAKAWAPDISVNCIAPGMIVQGEVEEAYEHFARKTPMQRNGTAQDVAAAAIFFATAPHFITGQLLAVDGGLGL